MAFCDPWSWWGTHNNLDWSARSCAPMGDCVSDIGVFEGLFDVHKAFDHCRNPDHLRLKYFGAERASELVQRRSLQILRRSPISQATNSNIELQTKIFADRFVIPGSCKIECGHR